MLKNVKEKGAKKVFIAKDAEAHITAELVKFCEANNIEIVHVNTMAEIGKMAGIEVGSSCYAEI